jgi:enoyl-CoA hydratase
VIHEYILDDGGVNLLSSSVLRQLLEAINSFDGDTFLLKSARPNIFAAGADMAEMQRFSPRDAYEFARLGQEVFETIERAPFLTIAQIDGDCFGGALDLVLAFDLRFATPRSRFAHPGGKLGIVTGFGGTSRWRKAIDRAFARRLFLGNERMSANEAMEAGLVDRVAESFDDELRRLEALDPATTRVLKELSAHADALSQSELMLLAERLRALYERDV